MSRLFSAGRKAKEGLKSISQICVLIQLPIKYGKNDKELEFTAKEYELLEYFMRNPNQVLTQGMISDQVWGGEINIFTNIIPVYVNYLRKKLRKVDTKELIHTVRGVGYILKEAV